MTTTRPDAVPSAALEPPTHESRRHRFVTALAGVVGASVVALAVMLAVVGGDDGGDATTAGPAPAGPDAVVASLCRAVAAARSGDLASAAAAFHDEAHDGIHLLAQTAADADRPASARLLEASAQVDLDLTEPFASSPTVTADLSALVTATADAVAASGGSRPAGCPS